MISDEVIQKHEQSMKEFTLDLKNAGRNEVIDSIVTSQDYEYIALDLKARLIVREDFPKDQWVMTIQSNVPNQPPEEFLTSRFNTSDLMHMSIKDIMDKFFAEHVLNHIIKNSTTQDSIHHVMEVLDARHKY